MNAVWSDRARSAAIIALTVAQPIAGRLDVLLPGAASIEERSRSAHGSITPADGAFAIWGPIFLVSLNLAVRGATPERRADPLLRRVGRLAGLSYASNIAWSLQTQLSGLGWPSFGIIATGATAACAALLKAVRARGCSPNAALAANSIAPLAGWLTIAAVANLEATLNVTRGRPAPRDATRRGIALIGAASLAAGAVTAASDGNALYAGAAAWGLSGIALRAGRSRNPAVAVAAVTGLAALLSAAACGRIRASRRLR